MWRKWRCKEGDWRLHSIFQSTIWPPMERFVAECRVNEKPFPTARRCCITAPRLNCQCGIYGVYDRAEVHRYGVQHRVPNVFDVECDLDVVGQFHGWGRIIECEHGAKVQFAYPYSLQVVRPFSQPIASLQEKAWDKARSAARHLRELYCVDVEVL